MSEVTVQFTRNASTIARAPPSSTSWTVLHAPAVLYAPPNLEEQATMLTSASSQTSAHGADLCSPLRRYKRQSVESLNLDQISRNKQRRGRAPCVLYAPPNLSSRRGPKKSSIFPPPLPHTISKLVPSTGLTVDRLNPTPKNRVTLFNQSCCIFLKVRCCCCSCWPTTTSPLINVIINMLTHRHFLGRPSCQSAPSRAQSGAGPRHTQEPACMLAHQATSPCLFARGGQGRACQLHTSTRA